MKYGKKYGKKICAWTMSAAMLLGSTGITVMAADPVEKEETVYVNAAADGTVDHVTVSDWLKNVSGKGELSDVSNLKDIKNVKGDESFEQKSDGSIVWKTDNKDIYYQGTTDEKLPVGVSVVYNLDGKEISPSELAGKSGKLTMTIHYKNDASFEDEIDGEKTKMNTPFLMASAIILPVDTFKNVTVTQGKLVSEGTNQILVAYGMPGLSKSLNLTSDMKEQMDKKLSDTVVVTAEVEDFSLGSIYTVATSDEFTNIELEDDSDIRDVEKAVNDLADATDDLLTGSQDLSDGLNTLEQSFDKYAQGVSDVKQGASDLADGAGKLKDGITKYTDGVKTLSEGTSQYVNGVQSLAAGVNSYVEGEKLIAGGINELYEGTKGFPDKYSQFSQGLEGYINGVNQIVNSDNTQALANGSAQVSGGIQNVNAGLGQLKAAVDALIETGVNLTDEQKAALSGVSAGIAGLSEATASDSPLSQGAATIAASLSTLNEKAPELAQGGESLKGASSAIGDGIGGTVAGISELSKGVQKLSENNDALVSGAATLNKKGADLAAGAGKLSSNSKKLASSAKKLSNGADALSKGTKKLNNATAEVSDGVEKLSNGSVDLFEGVHKFKLEGTGKLQSKYNDTIKTVIDRFRSLSADADSYKSFSGIADGMDGKVKFIFQTEGVGQDDK